MTRDPSPQRLDALLDGTASPQDETERDVLRLAAELRAGTPAAGPALRARVEALGEPAAGRVRRRRRLAWALAPSLGAVLAAAVTVGVLTGRGSDPADRVDSTAQSPAQTFDRAATDAAPAAEAGMAPMPAAAQWTLADGTLEATIAEIREAADRAGAGVTVDRPADGRATLTIRTGTGRLDALTTRLGAIGARRVAPGAVASPPAVDGVVIRVELAEEGAISP